MGKGGDYILAQRVEQHVIRKTSRIWRVIDQNCFFSKNLYNYANYVIRQEFIGTGQWLRYGKLDKMLHNTDPYKELKSQPSQQTLSTLDSVWKSYFKAIRDWKIHPEKYLGMPKIPKYLKKNGRFPWYIKNNNCYIKDGILHFQVKRLHGVTFQTNVKGRLLGVRFIPRGSCYVMEIITEVNIPDHEQKPMSRIAGIDLGVNNFATITNNIGAQPIIVNGKGLKSINQFYNKRRAQMQSELKRRNDKHSSSALEELTFKRLCRVKSFMHTASKKAIIYCLENDIDTLICGLNGGWKQEVNTGRQNNQKFCSIPYDMFIRQLEYKCQEVGIRFVTTEESYTSGTSFLDDEQPNESSYNKSRRIKRGLFQSGRGLINADVNGSLQIIKKVSENAFAGYSVGVAGLQPTILNVA